MTFSASQWQPTTYDNDTFKLDGYDFMVSSEYSHSFRYNATTDTYRFEVRDGDQFSSSRFTDVAGSERSEISQSLRQSISGAANYTSAQWSFMLEPGPANTAKWMSLGQFHSGMNKSGPFDFGLRGDDKLSFVIRSGQGEKEIELPSNVQRGKWYDIKVDLHFGPSGGGYVKVWLDGQQVVNYSGAVGYTDQSTTHWNMGVYRSSPAGGETIAYNVKGFDLSYGSSATAAKHGTPTFSGSTQSAPTPNETVAAPPVVSGKVLKGGSTDNSLSGTVGNDKIYGYAGEDTVLGNDGDDDLSGGNGNDHLKGEKGNDYLNGGYGNDYMYGGAGADIFSFNAKPGPTNVDHIAGFNPQQDSIYLYHGTFTKLGSGSRSEPGALNKDFFTIGERAKDANDHVIYDKVKGILYYDADGSGAGEAVAFATIGKNLKMTHADFFVI